MNSTSTLIYLFGVVQFITCSCVIFAAKSIFFDNHSSITPLRWLIATFLPIAIVARGLKKKSLSWSGALLGLVMAFVLTLAHWSFLASLLVFFVTSSKATTYKQHIKRSIEGAEFKEGGQRNWVQVLCNGGVAAQLALFYLLDIGSADHPVDFGRQYRASWLGTAILGSLACCGGDTWASELGTVLSKNEPYLITTFRRVPKGTNGGVSLIGLLCSLAGGFVVGVGYYVAVLISCQTDDHSPNQAYLVVIGAVSGLLGSLIDSILGATLQFSGLDTGSKSIVERPGPDVKHISGIRLLDNHSVNLISSLMTAILTPYMAMATFY